MKPLDERQRRYECFACIADGTPRNEAEFVVDANVKSPACPRCKTCSPITIVRKPIIHLLLRSPKGPIVGEMGLRWECACDASRRYTTLDGYDAFTGDPSACSCEPCNERFATMVAQGKLERRADGVALFITQEAGT